MSDGCQNYDKGQEPPRTKKHSSGSMQRSVRHEPKRKTCWRCDGAKWFDSAIGPIACQSCDGSGKGEIDIEWLVADWKRLKQWEHELATQCDDEHHSMMNGPRIAQSLMPNGKLTDGGHKTHE